MGDIAEMLERERRGGNEDKGRGVGVRMLVGRVGGELRKRKSMYW